MGAKLLNPRMCENAFVYITWSTAWMSIESQGYHLSPLVTLRCYSAACHLMLFTARAAGLCILVSRECLGGALH